MCLSQILHWLKKTYETTSGRALILSAVACIFLSILMLIFNNCATGYSPFINGYQGLAHPDSSELFYYLKDSCESMYKSYFYVDICFAIVFPFFLFHLYRALIRSSHQLSSQKDRTHIDIRSRRFSKVGFFVFLAILASLFDLGENILFLIGHHTDELFICHTIKYYIYALLLTFVIYEFLMYLLLRFGKRLAKTYRFYYLGLFVVLALYLLLSQVDQGIIFFVSVYDKWPWAVAFCFVVVLSVIGFWSAPKHLVWKFYLSRTDNNKAAGKKYYESLVLPISRALAFSVLLAVILLHFKVFLNYCTDLPYAQTLKFVLGLILFLVLSSFYCACSGSQLVKDYNRKVGFGGEGKTKEAQRKRLHKEQVYVLGWLFLLLSILLFFISTFVLAESWWAIKISIYLVAMVLFSLFFIMISFFRRVMRRIYTWGDKTDFVSEKKDPLGVWILYNENIFKTYVFVSVVFGAFFLFVGIFTPQLLSPVFHPLIIGVVFFNFVISIIVLLSQYSFEKGRVSVLGQRLIIILVIALFFTSISKRAEFFHVVDTYPIKEDDQPDSLLTYTRSFLDKHPCDSSKPRERVYFIAADGGGMPAAYLNMRVMQQMEKIDPGFYERTFLISSVSGGAVGQGMFQYLKSRRLDLEEEDERIRMMGNENILAIDIGMMLSRLPLMKYLPVQWDCAKDRSWEMARKYFDNAGARESNDSSYKKLPYSSRRNKERRSSHLPAIIFNTTRTADAAHAMVWPLKCQSEIFPSSVNLSQFDLNDFPGQSSISFYDAIFMTNRFPIVSPSAIVTENGYFTDGGLWDNTGLFAIYAVLDHMHAAKGTTGEYREFFDRFDLVLMEISYSKSAYLREHFLESYTGRINRINHSTEISNLLSSVSATSLEGIPEHQRKAATKYFDRKNIHFVPLPYKTTVDEVQRYLGGQVDTASIEDIRLEVDARNHIIDSTYFFPPPPNSDKLARMCNCKVHPALGRIMSTPALDYIKTIVSHPDYHQLYLIPKRRTPIKCD